MNNDELLQHCKNLYPLGTKYNCALAKDNSNINRLSEVRLELRLNSLGNTSIISDGAGGAVYFNGRFAEIVEVPKHITDLQEALKIIYTD